METADDAGDATESPRFHTPLPLAPARESAGDGTAPSISGPAPDALPLPLPLFAFDTRGDCACAFHEIGVGGLAGNDDGVREGVGRAVKEIHTSFSKTVCRAGNQPTYVV